MIRIHPFAGACAAALCLLAARAHAWEYSGDEGPMFWADLDPAYVACGLGIAQSPIDISRPFRRGKGRRALALDLHDTPIYLVNDGHTVEGEYEPGSTLVLDGLTYDLEQFHFHTLAEHTIRGRRHPLEMHAVFRHAPSGCLAVIGQLFKVAKGHDESAFLGELYDHLPEQSNEIYTSPEPINLADGLRNTRSYFTYQGSLTTPPCAPIVSWIVLSKVAPMSEQQYAAFRGVLGNNFRPTQPRNDREILRR